MEETTTYDHLQYTKDNDIKKLIKSEVLLFTDRIIKINRYSMSQERNILITNLGIYNLKNKSKS